MALSAPAAAQTIDTLPAWNGTAGFSTWGAGATATYGQTITAPGQSRLTGFSFELANYFGAQSQFTASVYRWDSVNNQITGSSLFTSAVMTSPASTTFTPVTANTGGVVLTPGQQYVLFLTTINVTQSGPSSYNKFGRVLGSPYAGGTIVYQNSTTAADLTTQPWDVVGDDFAFVAVFGPGSLSPQLPTGTPRNPVNVAGGIDKFLDGGGSPSGGFQILTGLAPAQLPGALTQLSGENGTATQQGGVQLTNLYLSLLTDPFAVDRGAGGSSGAMGFAAERPSANLPPAIASAYAAVGKAPSLEQAAAPRWNVWGTAFGGSSKTNGDAVIVGSHDVRSSAGGFAAGADYRLSADTRVGFSLAGGSTSWSLAGDLGNGRSDVLLAGLYGSHKFGAAYVSGAVSYGNYWTSAFRTVRVAGADTLRADFNAQDLGARIEGGYRIPLWAALDMTPYAVVQVQEFRTPSYAEAATVGSAQFALNYEARTVTAVRTELGNRIGKSWHVPDGSVLNLFGKAAWARDEISDPRLNVSFVGLPVASFAVNGATPARDLALVTAGAEWQFRSGISVMAKFDGEFAERSLTYAGTARLRYAW
ncbi:autotransporter family protein [Bradyrhizobium sp. 23AC]